MLRVFMCIYDFLINLKFYISDLLVLYSCFYFGVFWMYSFCMILWYDDDFCFFWWYDVRWIIFFDFYDDVMKCKGV